VHCVTYNNMVVRPLDDEEVDRLFGALADRTRRDIVARVLAGEASVSALAERYEMSFAAVQKHVAVLERAGLVTKHPHGRERLVRGDVDTLRAATRLLDQLETIWRGRIGRLEDVLGTPDPGEDPCPS
jgi:DNA-binding transcriptional ArsR family regulator